MDRSELAKGILSLAQADGIELGDDLEAAERAIRDLSHQVGAEALRQHLDANKPGYEGSHRLCPGCAGQQRFVNHRPRRVVTLLGEVRIKRAYYHCPGCKTGSLPWDERVGLGRCLCSVAAAKAATWCAVHEPFEQASAKLAELAGLRLDDSTIHRLTQRAGRAAQQIEPASAPESFRVEAEPDRLYTAVDGLYVHLDGGWREVKAAVSYWDDDDADDGRTARYRVHHASAEQFVPLVESLVRRCGHHRATENVLLGDGAKWVWQRIGAVMKPQTVHITDWYHVIEQAGACAKALHGEATPQAAAWIEPIKSMLWEGELRRLRAHLGAALAAATTDAHRRAIESLTTYIRNQGERLVYDDFRAKGYDIGSGRVEAACKAVVEQRAKRSGMRWSSPGFQATLSLRCAHLNRHDQEVWARRPLAA